MELDRKDQVWRNRNKFTARWWLKQELRDLCYWCCRFRQNHICNPILKKRFGDSRYGLFISLDENEGQLITEADESKNGLYGSTIKEAHLWGKVVSAYE